MANSVFHGAEPTWANACVGENGYVDYLTYAEGYSKASRILLEFVLEHDGKDIDSFIYPICFNMRHSIELRLKGAIEKLFKLASIKKVSLHNFQFVQKHDIGIIWNDFKEYCKEIDNRFEGFLNGIDTNILDLAEVDATGQTFRYPFDNDGNRHLVEQKIINCSDLLEIFLKLEKALNNIDTLINNLIKEYTTGTFTKKFSRKQIFDLAKNLPSRDKWKTELDKEGIKQQYHLSSNELNKIIKLIEQNYETSFFIGVKLNLKSLSDELIYEICQDWKKLNSNQFDENKNEDDFGIIGSGDLFKLSVKYLEDSDDTLIYQKLMTKLTLQNIADLTALFYLSRDQYKYSEYYKLLVENYEQELINESDLFSSFKFIFSKSNFLKNILTSLYLLGQYSLAEKIVINLELEKYYKFIPSARDRSLFDKWQYS